MQSQGNSSRPRGRGSLHQDSASAGGERPADATLGHGLAASRLAAVPVGRLDIEAAGQRFISQLQALGRKKSTLEDYESTLRVHLVPFFGERPLETIDVPLVEEFIYTELERRQGSEVGQELPRASALDTRLRDETRLVREQPRRARREATGRHQCRHPLPDSRRARGDPRRDAVDTPRANRPARLSDRRHDRDATGRGGRDPLARHRLGCTARSVSGAASPVASSAPRSRAARAAPCRSPPGSPTSSRAHYEQTPYRDEADLVFAHPDIGGVLDPSKLRKRFLACARRAGVRPVRFHDLRHTFGTQMAAAGAPMRAIQAWLGHADLRTTLIYADYALDPNQGALYAERAFGDAPQQ